MKTMYDKAVVIMKNHVLNGGSVADPEEALQFLVERMRNEVDIARAIRATFGKFHVNSFFPKIKRSNFPDETFYLDTDSFKFVLSDISDAYFDKYDLQFDPFKDELGLRMKYPTVLQPHHTEPFQVDYHSDARPIYEQRRHIFDSWLFCYFLWSDKFEQLIRFQTEG